ncbi:MAG: hypothetical protein PHZ19_09625 [Candidatus Thermoplasmatota archaeon]|nr:hypothetical protein [Candidatus Thermoplasmatota archaeon]
MDWIVQLKDLSVGIAFAVVFVIGTVIVLKRVVQPFQSEIKSALQQNCTMLDRIVTNHLDHDREERKNTREVMKEVSRALERQTEVLNGLVDTVQRNIHRDK